MPAQRSWRCGQHLENVKQRLLEFSNVDDIYFDGYLFESSGRWTTR